MNHDPTHPLPLWAAQWHERAELAALLGCSERTIHRAVARDDIDRRERSDGVALFKLRLASSWSRERLEGDRHEGSTGSTREIDTGSTRPPRHVDPTPHVDPIDPHERLGSPPSTGGRHAQGSTGSTPSTPPPRVDPSRDELRAEIHAMREQIEGVAEVVTRLEEQAHDAQNAPESDANTSHGAEGAQDEQTHERAAQLVWWRALLVSMLMRIKLLADRWLARIDSK